jgi:hypothetical protein
MYSVAKDGTILSDLKVLHLNFPEELSALNKYKKSLFSHDTYMVYDWSIVFHIFIKSLCLTFYREICMKIYKFISKIFQLKKPFKMILWLIPPFINKYDCYTLNSLSEGALSIEKQDIVPLLKNHQVSFSTDTNYCLLSHIST